MATVLPLVALPPPPRPSADLRVLAAAAGALGFATGLLCVTFLPFGSWSVPSSAAWATMPLALSPATMGGRLSQHIPRSTGVPPAGLHAARSNAAEELVRLEYLADKRKEALEYHENDPGVQRYDYELESESWGGSYAYASEDFDPAQKYQEASGGFEDVDSVARDVGLIDVDPDNDDESP
uniref:Uncharacterized protein n=1 Tax=Eutreptiella gymnastica TaxID=73025 RepID=A0A7S4LLE6_9EUGL